MNTNIFYFLSCFALYVIVIIIITIITCTPSARAQVNGRLSETDDIIGLIFGVADINK